MRAISAFLTTTLALGAARAAELDVYAVRARLRSVEYRSCGTGGPGLVDITFAPSGEATNAEVHDGHWTDAAIACVESRFSVARIDPFDGPDRTVRYHVTLPPDPPPPSITLARRSNERTFRGKPLGPGYHLESRPRTGLTATGISLLAVGLAFMVTTAASSCDPNTKPKDRYDRDLLFLGGALMAVAGGVVWGIGSIPRNVPVRDQPLLLTMTTRF